MKLIDLSHSFSSFMPVFGIGIEQTIKQIKHLKEDGYNEYSITCGTHVGTHIDGPLHMLETDRKISDYPLEKFCGKAVLIDARDQKVLGKNLLDNIKIEPEYIVLFLTGYDKKFRKEDYFENYPVFTEELAKELVKLKLKMVGMDTPSPDKHPFDIHKILLKEEILILENLTNLDQLLEIENFQIFAFPPKFEIDSSFVRVVARVF